ncbi:MAG: TMEM198/TM7SF3 family protein [Lachnospiraceae bacterium]|nr:TMEM198/TM7SF3 family protein [Lachnospiraceae bacterium]
MDKFVLRVPEWQGELLFTEELLVFVGVIILMLVGILFCFWGYKYFRTVLFLGCGAVTCYASFLLIESMTGNLVIRMFLTVSLTFLGICIVYFLDIILGYFLDRLWIRNALGKNIYLIAAPLGAVIIGMTIYWFIWRDQVTAAVAAAVCGVGGLIFQHFRRTKVVRFKCYNDLLRIPRLEAEANGLEYIAMETVVSPESEPVATVTPETVLPESESDILEDAPFIGQISGNLEDGKQPKQPDIEYVEPESAAPAPRIVVTSEPRRKHHKNSKSKLVKGVAVAAAGIGLFIAGRASKGRE